MSRWYAFLGAVLVAGAVVSVVFGAWPLAVVLLVVGGGGLLTEFRQRRRSSAAIEINGRAFAAKESLKGQMLAQQQQAAQGWAGGGANGSFGGWRPRRRDRGSSACDARRCGICRIDDDLGLFHLAGRAVRVSP